MRVVKDAEERKNEILDVAEQLFCRKGFDGTSTNDILKEIGIARGTLYYHFKSKEEILDAIIERTTNQLTGVAAKIALDETIPVLERLTRTIISLNLDNEMGDILKEQVHRPQNALFHQKVQEQFLSKVQPLIVKILQDGMDQDIWETKFPEEAVEMILIYSNVAFDDVRVYSEEEQQRKIAGFIYNTERILGMEEGNLLQTILPIFRQ